MRKKTGELRVCVDFRRLNAKTIRNSYPLPRITETLEALKGAQYFCTLDLQSGYLQVKMKEEDQEKTAMTTPFGLFEFNRMAFGLTNAPASFQRLMERCLAGLNLRICLAYLDDIIVFGQTVEEVIERLEVVLKRLGDFGLKLKTSKCKLFQTRVRYLGHVVSKDGVEPDSEKVNAVKEWLTHPPTNAKELQTFVGFSSYYRCFIEGFSKISRPLHSLVGQTSKKPGQPKRRIPFQWTTECQVAFETLIQKLISSPILAYPDFELPFVLHTDASSDGLGAALYQVQDGKQRVIAYGSRTLNEAEKRYSAYRREILAMKWAVTEKFRDYLYGRSFDVLTDSNPLTYLTTTAKLNATDHRWLSSLSTFDFTISYRAGKANGDADGLSRIHARGDDHETQETPKEEYLNPFLARIIPNNEESAGHLSSEAFQGLCLFYGTNEPFSSDEIQAPAVEAVYMSSEAVPTDSLPRHEELFSWSSNDWRRLQDQDRVIAHVLRILHSEQECTSTRGQRSQLPKDVYCLLREKRRLVIQDGILYRTRHNDGEERLQLVLLKAIRSQALRGLDD